jgi:hypothetical protein
MPSLKVLVPVIAVFDSDRIVIDRSFQTEFITEKRSNFVIWVEHKNVSSVILKQSIQAGINYQILSDVFF